VVGASETARMYNISTTAFAAAGGVPWATTLAQKTLDEMYAFHTNDCGGGILWSRDPASNNNYKSTITQLLYLQLAARTSMVTGNQTVLKQAEQLFDWLITSKVIDTKAGIINDGIDAKSCGIVTTQWSYEYGVGDQFLILSSSP
jgi:mannan endo-1,6-alpha-mannosidase